MGKVFVQRYFSIDILEQANKMLTRIRDAFRVLLPPYALLN